MISTLVSRVFSARNATHQAHFKTNSFSQHMALGEFYEAVIDLVDELVECYQGLFGLIDPEAIPYVKPDNIPALLEADLAFINSHRAEITQGDRSLENLLDTISAAYQKTLYKLENLS